MRRSVIPVAITCTSLPASRFHCILPIINEPSSRGNDTKRRLRNTFTSHEAHRKKEENECLKTRFATFFSSPSRNSFSPNTSARHEEKKTTERQKYVCEFHSRAYLCGVKLSLSIYVKEIPMWQKFGPQSV